MLNKIYNALVNDSVITEVVGNRIKYYDYPETGSMEGTHIIIDPLDTPRPDDFADDTWLTEDCLFQIDVWSKSLHDRNIVAKQVQSVMWELGFINYGGGVDEWDKDLNIFRDVRRYRGKVYVDSL